MNISKPESAFARSACHLTLFLFFLLQHLVFAQAQVRHESGGKTIRIQDKAGSLVLIVDYDEKLIVSRLDVLGQTPVSNDDGVFSAVKIDDQWFTTKAGITTPEVSIAKDRVTIDKILYGDRDNPIKEKWVFVANVDYVDWSIERKYPAAARIEDTGFPQWSFNNMETWTGALLGTGGVAWAKLFDRPNASFGNHTGEVTLWNQENKAALRITAGGDQQHYAVRFTRQPDDKWTLNYTASNDRIVTKHALSRFIRNRQDIWDTLAVTGTVHASYRLQAVDYDTDYHRGHFPGLDGESIRRVLNTIARVGVIDENIIGSNNWHLSAGFAVLHEQWIAQMGLAINDPNYLRNHKKALDYFRDHAVSADGRVKPRWAYVSGDHEPGTYDENGFYEAQWGRLLDSNTDQVINVAELFHMNGDVDWVRTHKLSCEKALAYLLQRDFDGDGLVEAMTDSYKEKRGSDWIDVIWASYENAFLNAKMYEALVQWAVVERVLGDTSRADEYLSRADKLKRRFNEPVAQGGFWDPEKKWYVYWRDKDDTIHGSNLVTPVNFMAIAYGICDDRERQASVLSKIESLMQEEDLFMWPISFFPFELDEGLKVNYPFPNYENGDIFLGWGEVGIRAYQNYDVNIPLKYIRNVLHQYDKDGLVFQRYDRDEKVGRGTDILANNALPVVGLYRNVFGIQPKYNRLYLAPHMTEVLNGTRIRYWLRDQFYNLELSVGDYQASTGWFSIECPHDFGIQVEENSALFFDSDNATPDMIVRSDGNGRVKLSVMQWSEQGPLFRKWMVAAPDRAVGLKCEINMLTPNTVYALWRNGNRVMNVKSDARGTIAFPMRVRRNGSDNFELRL